MNYISNVLGGMLDAGLRLCKKKKASRETMVNYTIQVLSLEDEERPKRRTKIEWVSPEFSPIVLNPSQNENQNPNIQTHPNQGKSFSEKEKIKVKKKVKGIKEFLKNSPKFYSSKPNLINFSKSMRSRLSPHKEKIKSLKRVVNIKKTKLIQFRVLLHGEIKYIIFLLEYNHVTLHFALQLADSLIAKQCLYDKDLVFVPYFCIQVAAKYFQRKRFSYEFLLKNVQQCPDEEKISLEEIQTFEGEMLKNLDFDFNIVLACNFVDVFALMFEFEVVEFILCHFLCELAIENYKIACQMDNFYIGAGCILLVIERKKNLNFNSTSASFCEEESNSKNRFESVFNLFQEEFNLKEDLLSKIEQFMKEKILEEFESKNSYSFEKFKSYMSYIKESGMMEENWAVKKYFENSGNCQKGK